MNHPLSETLRWAGLGLAVLLGLAALIFTASGRARAQVEVPASQAQIQLSFAPVVREAAPAVVNVYAERRVTTRVGTGDPFFDQFFGLQPRERVGQSLGSGVIVDGSGVIVTNNHVVEGATDLKVVLSDRREFDAQILLTDKRTDLAVLLIDGQGETFRALELASTRDIEVGDLVLAIGNPFGVGQTVTSGIVSATSRTDVGVSDYAFFIQTDAAINPGNSGGALVDMNGRLIGVNTAIFSRSGGSNGIGFAIPAEMVSRVVESAQNGGSEVVRPWLGLKTQAVTSDLAKSLGLDRPGGALVADLWDDGPADKAGVRIGDVILELDGDEVLDPKGLQFVIGTKRPDEQVEIAVVRDGKRRVLRARTELLPEEPRADRTVLRGMPVFSGLQVENLSPATASKIGADTFKKGVIVSGVVRGSPADRYGFRPGDIFESINGEEVASVADLDRIVQQQLRNWEVIFEREGQRIRSRLRA